MQEILSLNLEKFYNLYDTLDGNVIADLSPKLTLKVNFPFPQPTPSFGEYFSTEGLVSLCYHASELSPSPRY
jgi:hypothetical protein